LTWADCDTPAPTPAPTKVAVVIDEVWAE
jgi:hypothetical protein